MVFIPAQTGGMEPKKHPPLCQTRRKLRTRLQRRLAALMRERGMCPSQAMTTLIGRI